MLSTPRFPAADREKFGWVRQQVRTADDGHGLPESLIHGNLLHSPHHALVSEQGAVVINWKASGQGPRATDFAVLVLGTRNEDMKATVDAYRQHVEVTDEELDRLEAVMWRRELYVACFGYRRNIAYGTTKNAWWPVEPPYGGSEVFGDRAAAARAALGS